MTYKAWEIKDHNLMLGGQPVSSVVKMYGTPLYLYNGGILIDRFQSVRKAFAGFDVLYALKANPNSEICRILANAGAGADVASLKELEIALEAGFKPDMIAFGGPAKLDSEMRMAVQKNIGTIDIESEKELGVLEEIGRSQNRTVKATLRVNTRHRPSTAGEFMAGVPSQFGVDEENLVDILNRFTSKYVRIQGIHAHVASQVLDPDGLLKLYQGTAVLAKNLPSALAFDLKVINFGGGIGVPYTPKDSHLDLLTIGGQTRQILSEIFPDPNSRPRFQLELGRFLVAECGIFLTQVIGVKKSRGVNFVITDTGINGLTRPAMPWAQQHPCTIVSKENQPSTGMYKVVGRTCLPADILCNSVELPDPQPGDILAIHNAGAYGLTMSIVLWSSYPIPKEVVFCDGEYLPVRKSWHPWKSSGP